MDSTMDYDRQKLLNECVEKPPPYKPVNTVVHVQSHGFGHGFSRPVMQQPQMPTVFVLQQFEEAAEPHCCMSWLSCLLCPSALPFGLAALLCSTCAYCDSDRKSRRCKSNCARGCSITALVVGAIVLTLLLLLFFCYPAFKNAVVAYFDPCSEAAYDAAFQSIINSYNVMKTDYFNIFTKLSDMSKCPSTDLEKYLQKKLKDVGGLAGLLR